MNNVKGELILQAKTIETNENLKGQIAYYEGIKYKIIEIGSLMGMQVGASLEDILEKITNEIHKSVNRITYQNLEMGEITPIAIKMREAQIDYQLQIEKQLTEIIKDSEKVTNEEIELLCFLVKDGIKNLLIEVDQENFDKINLYATRLSIPNIMDKEKTLLANGILQALFNTKKNITKLS